MRSRDRSQTGVWASVAEAWAGIVRLRTRNAAGLIYGAIVCAATLAVAAPHQESGLLVLVAVLLTLLVYFLVHVFTEAEADRLEHPEASVGAIVRTSVHDEAAVLFGGLPAVAVFGLALLFGASSSRAVDFALWVTVGLLAIFGVVVGRTAGAKGWPLVLEVAVTAQAGVVMIGLKGLLH